MPSAARLAVPDEPPAGVAALEEERLRCRAAGDARCEARALFLAGRAHRERYEHEKALEVLEAALKLRRALGDPGGEAEVLFEIGQLHDVLGNPRRRLEIAREIVEIHRKRGDRKAQTTALVEVGSAYANVGALQEALDLFQEALAISRETGHKPDEASCLINIGAMHDELGDAASAIGAFEQALAVWRSLENRVMEANAYNNLAGAYSSLGDSAKALDLYRRALAVAAELGEATLFGRATTMNNIGHELNVLGAHEDARTELEEALRIAVQVGSTAVEAAVRVNLGAACAGLGRRTEARQHYERGLALARARGDRSREAKALEHLARLQNDAGEVEEALGTAEAAIAVLEAIRRDLTSARLRSSFITSVQRTYELYVDVLMGLHRGNPAAGFDARALHASELARARGLLDSLGETRARIREGVDVALLDQEQALRDRLSAAVDRHMRLSTSHPEGEKTRATAAEVQALTSEWETVRGRLRAASPRFTALRDPEPLTVSEIQQAVLDEDTVLLEYALGEKRSFLWVVTKSSLASFELPARAGIEATARAAYERLARSQAAPPGPEADAALARLSALVVAPALPAMAGKRLLVVADGALHYVPFAALPHPGGGGEPLGARYEIVAAPSASAVAQLRRDIPARVPPAGTLAVLADPVFGPEDERVARAPGARADAARTRAADAMPDLQRALGGNTLPRLPFTRREAETILKLAPAARRKGALGFDASRAAATDGSLVDYRIVHFATHGFLNAAHPELSGIVLSLLDRQGRPTRGFLSVADVFNMHLSAELVVLSGCRTALGREIRGEGMVGLSRGFMYAGAPRLVASLWQVDDAATALLMGEMYRGILIRKERPAAALRTAQRRLMSQPRFRDPYYWAAFQLQGEWR